MTVITGSKFKRSFKRLVKKLSVYYGYNPTHFSLIFASA